jgi:DNA-binding XRE family transcriptional regulator
MLTIKATPQELRPRESSPEEHEIRGFHDENRHNDSRPSPAKRPVAGRHRKKTGLLRCYLSRVENGHTVPSLDTLSKIAQALDLPIAQFFAEDSLNRELNTQKLSDEELRFLTQIRRYSTNLNESDRKLLLAMVKKFAATAVR